MNDNLFGDYERLELPLFVKEFFEFLGYKDVELCHSKSSRTYVLTHSENGIFFYYSPLNDKELQRGFVSYYMFNQEGFDKIIEQWRLKSFVKVNDIHKTPVETDKYILPKDELEWEIMKLSLLKKS